MSKLTVQYEGEEERLDEFFKSLVFQQIIDSKSSAGEKLILSVIFRKTLHYDKWEDTIAMHWLSASVSICESKTRRIIKQLEAKGLITVTRSKGGKGNGAKRFHTFSLSNDFIFIIVDKWANIKGENNFKNDYE